MRLLILIIIIYLSSIACSKDENTCVSYPLASSMKCIDSTIIDSTSLCLDVYEPVCGCDNVTYSNACYATIFYGVTSYVNGECCD